MKHNTQLTSTSALLMFSIGLTLSGNIGAAPPSTTYATTAALQAEISARQAADAAENTARQAADSTLQSNINTLQSQLNVSTHVIGETYGGGTVFYVNASGTHGLIAANVDQLPFRSAGVTWFDAEDIISNPANHDTAGQAFTDWRLPTKYELNLLYEQKIAGKVGGFVDGIYWSSTEFDVNTAWAQSFGNFRQGEGNKINTFNVRAVRAF